MHPVVAEEKGTTMGAKDSATKTGAAVDELREDMNREFDGGHKATGQMVESTRSHPARWASVGTVMVAAVAATIGVLKWRRDRRTPQGRAKRAWRNVTRSATKRFGR
jgi:hypothetical protein